MAAAEQMHGTVSDAQAPRMRDLRSDPIETDASGAGDAAVPNVLLGDRSGPTVVARKESAVQRRPEFLCSAVVGVGITRPPSEYYVYCYNTATYNCVII